MKTRKNKNTYYLTVNLPEIIVWILGIITFIGLFFGFNLNAQTLDAYNQDTIWLKSREVIPCKLVNKSWAYDMVTIQVFTEDSGVIFKQRLKKEIKCIKEGLNVRYGSKPKSSFLKNGGLFYASIGFIRSLNTMPETLLDGEMSAAVVFKKNIGISFRVNFFHPQSQNIPKNYQSGGIVDYNHELGDKLYVFSLCFLKNFNLKSRFFRIGLEGGPSYVYYSENQYNYIPNYSPPDHHYGFTIRAKSELIFPVVFGLELALFSNINNYRCLYGFELVLNIGKVRSTKYIRL